MKLVIVTGGTGGHIYPALALAKAWSDSEGEVVFIGNYDRMEAKLIPEANFKFYGLKSKGLAGNLINKLSALALVPYTTLQARKILKKEQADIVIGFGGYITTPVLLAAQQLKITNLIHEQNSIFGKANKLVSKKVDKIITCYDNVDTNYPEKTINLGNPRASEIVTNQFDEVSFNKLGLDPTKKKILVVMGSLGSSSVNELLAPTLDKLSENFEVVLVSGKNDYESSKARYLNSNVKVVDYIDQGRMVQGFDLIICRAGATTAAEICALGTLALLIPSPYVANNHQLFNALQLSDRQAALLVEEKDLNKNLVYTKVSSVLNDEQLANYIKANALKLGKRDAITNIIQCALAQYWSK